MFGQGFVTLDTLDTIPADKFAGWTAFVVEWDRLADERKAIAEHRAAMDSAKNALK